MGRPSFVHVIGWWNCVKKITNRYMHNIKIPSTKWMFLVVFIVQHVVDCVQDYHAYPNIKNSLTIMESKVVSDFCWLCIDSYYKIWIPNIFFQTKAFSLIMLPDNLFWLATLFVLVKITWPFGPDLIKLYKSQQPKLSKCLVWKFKNNQSSLCHKRCFYNLVQFGWTHLYLVGGSN